MTESTNASGTGAETSSAGTGQGGANDQNQDLKPIDPKEHESIKRDMFRYKDQLKSQNDELSTLKQKLQDLEAKGLAEANDYKTLYEREREAKAALEAEKEKLRGSVLHSERYRAVLPKLKELGLRDDALNLLDREDLSSIEVEATSNGRFICHGMETFAKHFRESFPYAFKEKGIGNVNGSGGSGAPPSNEPVTASSVIEAEKKWRAGKIQKSEYEAIHRRYLEQKRA